MIYESGHVFILYRMAVEILSNYLINILKIIFHITHK